MVFLAALSVGVFFAVGVALFTGTGPARLFQSIDARSKAAPATRSRLQGPPEMRPLQRVAATLLVGLSTFGVVFMVLRVSSLALPVAVAAGIGGPTIYLERRRQQWRRKRLQAWPEAIRELVSGILAARSLHQSLVGLSTVGPESLRFMWRQYAVLSQSLDPKSALEAVRDDLADPVTDRVLEVLILAFDAGPSVVLDILRDLADSISEDLHLVRRIDVANTEEKITAWMTVLLPMVMLVVVVLIGGGAFRRFYESGAGFAVVAVGTALSVASFVIVSRLGRATVEPRLFAQEEPSRG